MIWLDIVSISNLDRNVTIFLFVYRNHTTSPHHTRPPRSIEQNKVRFKCCYELVIFVRSNKHSDVLNPRSDTDSDVVKIEKERNNAVTPTLKRTRVQTLLAKDVNSEFLQNQSQSTMAKPARNNKRTQVARKTHNVHPSVSKDKLTVGKDKLKCEFCDKCFRYPSVLKVHERYHTGEKPCKCHVCEKSFHNNSHLIAHLLVHGMEKPNKCKVCGNTFGTNTDLQIHNQIHTSEKPHKCQVCRKSFTCNSHLTRHLLVHGITVEMPYKCEVCGKSFRTNISLNTHNQLHTGKIPHICKVCGKTFLNRHCLAKHNMIHTGEKPSQCEICGKSFAHGALSRHLQLHKPTVERPYKCKVCGKTFLYSNCLARHNRIHTGEKPHQCEKCGKSFGRRDHLSSHLQNFDHTSNKKPCSENKPPQPRSHKCKMCERSFTRSNHLVQHNRTYHSGEKP